MGCYMSTPDDKVYITEGKGKNFIYATASCQGWRREQEDAEDCIPYFDDQASLFILCDGHGGAEVAEYTVKHFPEFLKNHPLYKEGKYAEALEKAFIDFDALLRTDKALDELSKIAYGEEKSNKQKQEDYDESSIWDFIGDADEPAATSAASSENEEPGSSAGPSSSNGPSSIAEDVDTETLWREAQVPLNELIDKYSGLPPVKGRANSIRQASLSLGGSPVIKSSQKDDSGDSETEAQGTNDQSKDTDALVPKSEQPTLSKQSDEGPSSSSSPQLAGVSDLKEILKNAIDVYFDENDDNSEDDSEFKGEEESENEDDDDDEGDDDDSDQDDDEDGDDECDEDALSDKSRNKRLQHKCYKQPKSGLIDDFSSEDDSDDDQDDEDEDDEEEDEESSGEEEDDGDAREEIELDGRYAYLKKLNRTMKSASGRLHKPGIDSGCTVVVALVKEKKLYVASAGDSRCIVIMRDGQCKPMSFDHKPEDNIEHTRILKAGGRVTEGRVNGGLNLSRAFGDFTYKDANLEAKDQMITPCPDVRTTDLDPVQVEYIFLACDGIWNSMKNQQVTKFIRRVAPTVNYDLARVSLSLFKNCIAPRTDGDGTGCDNMTCIIARYDSSLKTEEKKTTNQIDLKGEEASADGQSDPNQSQTTTSQNDDSLDKQQETVMQSSNKRSAQEDDTEKATDRSACKRRCTRLPRNNNSQY